MGSKQNKCCCCPDCFVMPDACCRCIPETICVTIDNYPDDSCGGELDWDRDLLCFQGMICGRDLLFYIERDDDGCFLKLRSESLGFPEGYEHEWQFGYEVDCDSLTTSVDTPEGLLEITKAEKVIPTECRCRGACFCECLCVTITRTLEDEPITCVGKACWDDVQHAYIGTITCNDYGETEYDVSIKLGRKGDYCTGSCPGDTEWDDCDPYDDRCVLVLNVTGLGIVDEWIEISNCEADLAGSWSGLPGPEPYETVDVSFHCAVCNEDCNPAPCDSCPDGLPRVLYATWIAVNRPDVQTCLDGLVVPLYWATGGGIGAGGFWSGLFSCPDCPACSNPDTFESCSEPVSVVCLGIDDPMQLGLTIGVGPPAIYPNPGASCTPYAEYGPFANIPSPTSCTDVSIWPADEPDPTYKIVLTA